MPKTHEECLELLEQLRWNGIPTCPYCGSTKSSAIKSEHRYHCRECFTSYSVTVGTIFHKTHIKLDKWFYAISLIFENPDTMSIRKLSKLLNISTHSATGLKKKINIYSRKNQIIFREIKEKYGDL